MVIDYYLIEGRMLLDVFLLEFSNIDQRSVQTGGGQFAYHVAFLEKNTITWLQIFTFWKELWQFYRFFEAWFKIKSILKNASVVNSQVYTYLTLEFKKINLIYLIEEN